MLDIFPKALKPLPEAAHDFLRAGDVMADRIRAFDWSRTPLGALASWPASLRNVVEHVTVADVASGDLPSSVDKLAEDPEAWITR